MKNKRLLCLLLVTLMMLSIFAGCGSKTSTEEEALNPVSENAENGVSRLSDLH